MMRAMLIGETFKLLTSFYDIVIVAIQQRTPSTHPLGDADGNDNDSTDDNDKMIETTILHFIVA